MYQKYFDELLAPSPTINDSLNLKKYKHLQHIYPNYYSLSYIRKQKELCNKYLDLLKNKKRYNFYDKVLKYSLEIELESMENIDTLFPINHYNNLHFIHRSHL